jgi:hypothetical protein
VRVGLRLILATVHAWTLLRSDRGLLLHFLVCLLSMALRTCETLLVLGLSLLKQFLTLLGSGQLRVGVTQKQLVCVALLPPDRGLGAGVSVQRTEAEHLVEDSLHTPLLSFVALSLVQAHYVSGVELEVLEVHSVGVRLVVSVYC